ncbi:MAG: transposase [Desulfobacterales bacterium]|nr:transposase [Desulfobacterales bacterium]MBF0399019.1 transposase [Desulfobacterales bacterium]
MKALKDVANIVNPETILKWYRELISKKFDGTKNRKGNGGQNKIAAEVEELILRFARENPSWGYDRIVGALSNLGYKVSDQTVGNILKKHGIPTAPDRDRDNKWADFIKSHQDILCGCDFFTTEVITPKGLVTYYILFFVHLASRLVYIAGATPNPDEFWMKQIARNITMDGWGFLKECGCKYLIHDRDSKFCESFLKIIQDAGVKTLRLPIKSPNLNAIAERWIRSTKFECISRLLFFGEQSLINALRNFSAHYHEERNLQGKGNVLLFPADDYDSENKIGDIKCRERIGGILKYYYREAA